MARIAVIGASGSLGSEVLRQAVTAHEVTAIVRSPSKLRDSAGVAAVKQLDIQTAPVASITEALAGHHAVINTAGHVKAGQAFVNLVARLIEALEALPASQRPVCWFLAGAAILDIRPSLRRGVDLPIIKSRYWPHRSNYERLSRSELDWRLLCPGPLVSEPELGSKSLRTSVDRLPVAVPSWALRLPGPLLTLVFARLVPQMIIPYGDAAAFILSNLETDSALSRRRVGVALPIGMHGRKDSWSGNRE